MRLREIGFTGVGIAIAVIAGVIALVRATPGLCGCPGRPAGTSPARPPAS